MAAVLRGLPTQPPPDTQTETENRVSREAESRQRPRDPPPRLRPLGTQQRQPRYHGGRELSS